MDEKTWEVLREVLLDPKDGLSSRLLVVEAILEEYRAKQDAILVALHGNHKYPGVIQIVSGLSARDAARKDRNRFIWRELLWKGAILSLVMVTIVELITKYT